ncbi:MAG: GTP cyclohydrolase I FolE [Myxococcota bacterium]
MLKTAIPEMSEDDVASRTQEARESHGTVSIRSTIHRLLTQLGEDPAREGLSQTPRRAAESWQFLTGGTQVCARAIAREAVFKSPGNDLVVQRNIEFYSLCEHHLLPFFGHMHVAYLPQGKLIGLSKIDRTVDVFARRLQLQERLTRQVADTLEEVLLPRGIAVIAQAHHLCLKMRGVQKQGTTTLTCVTRGAFDTDTALFAKLLHLLNLKDPLPLATGSP